MTRFEKTKPICSGTDLRKVLYERNLWQHTALWGTKKQSQTKHVLSPFGYAQGKLRRMGRSTRSECCEQRSAERLFEKQSQFSNVLWAGG